MLKGDKIQMVLGNVLYLCSLLRLGGYVGKVNLHNPLFIYKKKKKNFTEKINNSHCCNRSQQ